MSFASKLKKRMSECEISQKELSSATGLGKTSISQYISGKNMPRSEALNKIAIALSCSVEYLLEEDETDIEGISSLHNVSISDAAKVLGKSQTFVRVALQQERAPFGFAVRNKSKWSYHISPRKLEMYLRGDI